MDGCISKIPKAPSRVPLGALAYHLATDVTRALKLLRDSCFTSQPGQTEGMVVARVRNIKGVLGNFPPTSLPRTTMSQRTDNEHLPYFTELMNRLLPVMYLTETSCSSADRFIGV